MTFVSYVSWSWRECNQNNFEKTQTIINDHATPEADQVGTGRLSRIISLEQLLVARGNDARPMHITYAGWKLLQEVRAPLAMKFYLPRATVSIKPTRPTSRSGDTLCRFALARPFNCICLLQIIFLLFSNKKLWFSEECISKVYFWMIAILWHAQHHMTIGCPSISIQGHLPLN